MFQLIVTNDEEVVKFARERGAGVFTAEKCPEEITTVTDHMTSRTVLNVHELLRELNIKPNIKGYRFIKFLMERCEADPDYHKRAITREIYPECAERFDTTPTSVERTIRHALDQSFGEVPEKYSQIFGGTFTKAPTNSELIGLVSEYFVNNK